MLISPEPVRGVNLIGHLSGNLGLGVSTRQIARLLLDVGEPFAGLDLDPGSGRGGRDDTFAEYLVDSPSSLPHPINLAVIPAGLAPRYWLQPPKVWNSSEQFPRGFETWRSRGHLNAAIVWWELPTLPLAWVKALEMFDVVIGASPFIRGVLESHVSNAITIPAVHPFEPPAQVDRGRAKYGLPEHATLFVTSFEPYSDVARKNPFAAIDAFQRAFEGKDAERLVIRLNNASSADATFPILKVLRDRCAADPRILVLDDPMSYVEALGLYASCDAFVSLHRSEGLGLGMMEAMSLGMPVIATGWSGNLAFMNHTSACLVRHRLVPVGADSVSYGPDAIRTPSIWAEPDVEDAAAWMRKLAADLPFRRELGQRAADAISEHRRLAQRAGFLAELKSIAAAMSVLPPRSASATAAALQDMKDAIRRAVPVGERWLGDLTGVAQRHLLWRFRR